MSPVLVHIGYHKTGTNWLQRLFFSNPATGYTWLGKSPGSHPVRRFVRDRPFEFDAAGVRAGFEPLLRGAEQAGLHPVVSLERLSGHPLSGGQDSRQTADRLHEVFPDARVLVVVREQRSFITSFYKGYVQQGGVLPLRDFLKPPTSRAERTRGFDLAFFEYHHLIRYYRSVFGEPNVLALPFDLFVEDGRAFVEQIAAFAGRTVPADVLDALPYSQRENRRGSSALTLSLVRRVNRFGPRSEVNPAPLVASKAVGRLATRLHKADPLRRLPTSDAAEKQLRDQVARVVGDRFAESNRVTCELVGADLGRYGWVV